MQEIREEAPSWGMSETCVTEPCERDRRQLQDTGPR